MINLGFSVQKKMKLFIYKISILFLISSICFAGEIRDKAESVIRENFGDSCQINAFKLKLDKNLKLNAEKHARQRFFSKFVYYYEIILNEEIVGYAILDNVLGKVKPITFMVMFNIDKTIKSVDVIKYREQHGGAVESKSWLDQFQNANLNSNLELNEDIDGISGATISVKSVISGVKKKLYLINNLGEDERDLLISIK